MTITETNMAVINARFAEHDRRLDAFASQYSQLSVQLGIMDSSVKKIECLVLDVEKKAEAHAEAIAQSLEKIMYALGIDDGKPDSAELVRLTIKGSVRDRAHKQGRSQGIVDDLIKWSIRGVIVFILSCVVLYVNQYIKQQVISPVTIKMDKGNG